eukprot:CAMPEP_0203011546 /NCGR_PEP_ID=MMETSP1401-20130829/12481_1 /ASSEMBLY_ACC=CAM_ASM_000894 /TAXON_ID=38833 /ORGANISM="Micromonas pusilla, Strain CCAC1681" /LENGTH=31 /DNA_ID= /DNA_START= /DNA_END= /DNA_ORIENTATION=
MPHFRFFFSNQKSHFFAAARPDAVSDAAIAR